MSGRVYEVARTLRVESAAVLARLHELGVYARSASSVITDDSIARVLESFGEPDRDRLGAATSPLGWRTGAVKRPTHEGVLQNIAQLNRAFPVSVMHQENLAALGSQIVHASKCKVVNSEDCRLAMVRFSEAIEAAFGFTREVCFFYSPYPELQIRTLKAARQAMSELPREVTPDVLFMHSPDRRMREKLDDWSSGNFLAIPLTLSDEDDPIALVSLLRDYIFSRDLFYETTPVKGDRFFGRRKLLQSLRDDVQNQRVTGLFGLRKSGKTSVLSQLSLNVSGPNRIVILQDLEGLPSPPADPVPDLLRDLAGALVQEFENRQISTRQLTRLGEDFEVADFKRRFQVSLRELAERDISVVILLDEIEYLTPADSVDIAEGPLASVAQLLGVLRSLVQENPNFTFVLSGLTSAIIQSGRLYGRPNPLFSWAKSSYVVPFERHEADDLAESVGRKMGISIEPGALEAFFEATGGHAFLYRHLASHIVRRLPVDSFHRRIERKEVLAGLEGWRRLVAGNVKEMVDHVKRYYPDESYLLDVLREEPEAFSMLAQDAPLAVGHLLNLGLIHEVDRRFELSPVLDMV